MDKKKLIQKIKESTVGYGSLIKENKSKGLTHEELLETLKTATRSIGKKKGITENDEIGAEPQPPLVPGAQDVVDTITLDIPLFLLLLEYAREKSKNDLDLHELTETTNKLGKERGILSSDDYTEITGESGDEKEEISESFTNRLRENIKSSLSSRPIKEDKKVETKKDTDTGGELESKPSTDDVPPSPAPTPDEGGEEAPAAPNPNATIANQGDGKVHPQVKSIQDALTQAQVAAQSLGDEKLLQQLGNTIVFFTKEYIVGNNKPQV